MIKMKLFRKVTSSILTLALGVSIFPASIQKVGATNICGDVNDNGVVDVTDASILSQYLLANLGSINLKNSDVDKNAVIDINDVKTIQAYIFRSISALPYNTDGIYMNNVTYSFPSDESRSYTKFNRETGIINSYTLNSYSQSALAALSFEDNRVIDSSSDDVRAIVQLRATSSSGRPVRGTGFIISDHVIATAAHCLYDVYTNSFYSDLSVTIFSSSGTSMNASYIPSEMHIPTRYISDNNNIISENDNPSCDYDYGLIYVPYDLSRYGKINLGLATDYFISTSSVVGISGFPMSDDNPARYYSEGFIRISNNDNLYLGSTAYASDGDSGGPLFIQYSLNGNEYRSAIGVFSCIRNNLYSKSIRITKPVLRFYNNNSNIGG